MRGGKKLTMKLLSSLERSEVGNFSPLIDSIPILHSFDMMSTNVAVNLIRREFDMLLYYCLIGRNTNFRYDDDTGIWRSKDPREYFQRIFSKRESEVLNQVVNREISPIFTHMTHDIMCNAKIMFEAYPDVLLVHGRRNPIDLVYSWHKRNWGDRIGHEPRSLALAFETSHGVVPWHATEWAERYISLSPIDRVIYSISWLLDRERVSYKELTPNQRDQVIPVTFEWMASKPEAFFEVLCKKIGAEMTSATAHRLLDERLPLVLSKSDFAHRTNSIKEEASPEAFSHLMEIAAVYEDESISHFNIDVRDLRTRGD